MLKCIIMGVAGAGKSSVGEAVAAQLGAQYFDGDDLHPQTNIDKMAAGIPLDDDDRAPWLIKVGTALQAASGPTIIGCSALKRAYRDRIRMSCADATVVHLFGSRQVIEARMSARTSHFMPMSLLDSQFSALEPLDSDEAGYVVDISKDFDTVVSNVVAQFS